MQYFLLFSFLLFGLGVGLVVNKRSYLAILLGIELIINSALFNFFIFSLHWGNTTDIQAMLSFIIAVVAANASIGLIMMLKHYRTKASNDPKEKISLKE